jgi:hypothetical protein
MAAVSWCHSSDALNLAMLMGSTLTLWLIGSSSWDCWKLHGLRVVSTLETGITLLETGITLLETGITNGLPAFPLGPARKGDAAVYSSSIRSQIAQSCLFGHRVWTRSKYVDNRETSETKVNRQLRKHQVESTFWRQNLTTVMT